VILSASTTRRRVLFGAALVLGACAAWSIRHVASLMATVNGQGSRFAVVYALAFLFLVWQTLLYSSERPYQVSSRKQRHLDRLYVVVPVPVYNEDPDLLRRCLSTIIEQDRPPQMICVVDDGSKVDYSDIQHWLVGAAGRRKIAVRWERTENHGKRHAQGVVIASTPAAEVYVTIDSDAVLAPDAIHELLKPLATPQVMSVAGVVLAINNRRNLLTRFTDLWFVTGQLVDRSALSVMGSVLVNSGVLAAYRADLLRRHLDGYLNETFFGRRIEFSDDSMLTLYALADGGRAVQQPSAFAFTAMPETLDHHIRQYLRWMRGAFIRSWWRFRYLPIRGYAYWGHLLGWLQMVLSTVIFWALFVVQPVVDRRILPSLIAIPILIGYGQALRYLTFRRVDESVRSQLLTVAMAPAATLWAFFVLRPIRWYAMATCLRTGWGTRQDVEVGLAPVAAGSGVTSA
jgi:hyaluronan synthase